MKITVLLPEGRKVAAKLPYVGASFVVLNNTECPNKECRGYSVRGNGQNRIESDRHEEEDAVCTQCKAPRGRLHVKFETLFGIEEDRRVFSGPWKVY